MANAAVFLMIGFTVNLESLLANAWPCAVAIAVVLLARVALLLGPGAFLRDQQLVTTTAERIVLAWSGLRGALTITLVLALPAETPYRELLLAMSFAVVLSTLVVQALTLPLLLRRLGLVRSASAHVVAA
jgi:CPA1 family monovalent cation:H+ antiporter